MKSLTHQPSVTLSLPKNLFLALLLCVSGCRCKDKKKPCTDPTNPDCENYDPCYGKKTVNTFFKVKPGNNGFPPPPDWCDPMPTDTFNASSVLFEIPDGNPTNSTYEWQIGAETRTDKKFEIDFSAHLNQGNWETHIPITLTIRTPMNECLQSEEETLKVITRELFFTHKSYLSFESRDSVTRYKGYFSHEPAVERTLEFFYLEDFNFRGIRDLLPTQTFDLLTGLPDFDTIWWKTPCNEIIGCGSFKHGIIRYFRQDNCFPHATGRITGYEIIRLSEDERIFRFEFLRPNQSNLKYEFTGKIIN